MKAIKKAHKSYKGVKAASKSGSSLNLIKKQVPNGWVSKVSKKGGGTRFIDPKNQHNSIRYMPGNPKSPYPNSQKPYVRMQRNGQSIDVNGNVVPKNSPEAHIPVDLFKGWPL